MYRLKHGFECHTGYNGTVATSARGPQARRRMRPEGGSRNGAIIARMAREAML